MTMKLLALSLLWLSCALLAVSAHAEATVEVFTLSTLPVTNARGATVFYLDAVTQLEQQLSQDLPADPVQAQAEAARRISALGPQLQARVRAGADGLARAGQLGVQRIPAIVFDGRSIVYGLLDVEAARRFLARSAQGSTPATGR